MSNKFKRFSTQSAMAILGGALVFGGGHALFERHADAKDNVKNPPAHLQVDKAPLARERKVVTSFADVVKKVSPAVVKVYITKNGKPVNEQMNPLLEDPMFRRFFGDRFGGHGEGMHPGKTPKEHGLGSGVIVTKDGYILTNNHVVDGADEVRVAVGEGGDDYTAKVVGTDPKSDIAVLKIDPKKSLPTATAGDSEKLEVGDVVLAVGNPFGIGQTVTMGIVSATGRATLGMDYEDFIQTDAAINPGNSGGALVDAEGRLIGINTAIISRSGGNQGIGFAIPMNLARSVMESIIENGHVIRGYMGVNIQDVTPALAKEFGVEEGQEGALVADVTSGSPAEKAGLKAGDVITELNGAKVRDSRHLKLQTAQIAPGTKVPVKINREGKEKELTVTLKEFPNDELASKSGKAKGTDNDDVLDGVTVGDLDASARQQFDIPSTVKGAVITEVNPETPSYEAGLREGDVVQEINRHAVKNADDAVALSDKAKGKSALLRVWSHGASHYLVVKMKNEKLG
jgi:serine protease Do